MRINLDRLRHLGFEVVCAHEELTIVPGQGSQCLQRSVDELVGRLELDDGVRRMLEDKILTDMHKWQVINAMMEGDK